MAVRIIIAGETQCFKFAEACLVADFLSQNLENFHYERIEKVVAEYGNWLAQLNIKYQWHHNGSPIVWKEMLLEGGKPFYIGGASEFLDYCYSYYKIDTYLWTEQFEFLLENFDQMKKKLRVESKSSMFIEESLLDVPEDVDEKKSFCVCIFGAGNPMTLRLTSRLLDMSHGGKPILKIFLYDSSCDPAFLHSIVVECSYIRTSEPGKCVRYVDKPGLALTQTDLLIVMDYEPFKEHMAIGEWLYMNRKKMEHLAMMLNSSATKSLRVVFPNIGPACYNATVLTRNINVINKHNVVVATADLGLDVASTISKIAEVPLRNMFGSPVWGFVGINHFVDINNTIHRYNSFNPYKRFTKVKNSTLRIGCLKPEMRTMEYLMYFDESLWGEVSKIKRKIGDNGKNFNKLTAVVDLVFIWLFQPIPDHIISLGVFCDGSFGLRFKGIFSQPARLVDGIWRPASDFHIPRDKYMSLDYLVYIARLMMKTSKSQLKSIVPLSLCSCKATYHQKKGVW